MASASASDICSRTCFSSAICCCWRASIFCSSFSNFSSFSSMAISFSICSTSREFLNSSNSSFMSLSSWDSLSNKTFSLFRWRFCCSRRALVCSATFLVSFSNASSSSRVFFWISCSTFKGSSSIAFNSFLFLFKRSS